MFMDNNTTDTTTPGTRKLSARFDMEKPPIQSSEPPTTDTSTRHLQDDDVEARGFLLALQSLIGECQIESLCQARVASAQTYNVATNATQSFVLMEPNEDDEVDVVPPPRPGTPAPSAQTVANTPSSSVLGVAEKLP